MYVTPVATAPNLSAMPEEDAGGVGGSPSGGGDALPSLRYPAIVAAFATALVVANIIAVKQVDILGLRVTAAVAVFPLSYLLADVLTEVYGFRRARSAIWIGFGCNALAVVAILVGQALPAAEFWKSQPAYEAILGYAPRILAGSFAAYLVGELANAAVMAKLKVATGGRFLWLRTISSTLVGEGLDTLVFVTVAFAGVLPDLGTLMIHLWLLKVAWEVLATPLTYAAVGYLKRAEGIDVYDARTPVIGRP